MHSNLIKYQQCHVIALLFDLLAANYISIPATHLLLEMHLVHQLYFTNNMNTLYKEFHDLSVFYTSLNRKMKQIILKTGYGFNAENFI